MHSFIPSHRFLPYLSWTDIQAMPDQANTVIIQPIGAVEQHGPHLPLIVDSAIATGILGHTLAKLPAEIPAYALPTLCYGKSNEHWHFPGTITLTATTLISLLMETAASIYRSGFRKLVLMNAHGGQPQIMEIVARDLHQQYPDFLVFPLFVWRVPHNGTELLSPEELEYGIHAGDAETSLILALLPEQVKMDRAVREYPRSLPKQSLLSMEGNLPFAWVMRDLSTSGVLGDATVASLDKGEKLLQSLTDGWVQAITDIYKFQQPQVYLHPNPTKSPPS